MKGRTLEDLGREYTDTATMVIGGLLADTFDEGEGRFFLLRRSCLSSDEEP